MEFEKIQDIEKNFIYEKQQIEEIEVKRTKLAQKRNYKKKVIANINYPYKANVESEIDELGKQISELGNQSQDLQNKLDARCLEIKRQVNNKIYDLATSNEDIFEKLVQNLIGEKQEIIQKCEEIEQNIELPVVEMEEIKLEELQPIGDVNITEINSMPEVQINDIPQIEEIQIEEIDMQTNSEIVEFHTIEEIQIEDNEPVIEIESIIEEVEKEGSIQKIIEEIEQEIITLEEQEEIKVLELDEKIKILNIVAKIVSGDVVYTAQISNGETIKIYPTKVNGENILLNDKANRNRIKEILLTYATSEYKMLDKKVIKYIDPTICQILNEFAIKYNCDAQYLIYNYAMSFSENAVIEIDSIPQITYNFSFIEEAEISKKEKSMLMKICKNARENYNIEVIGYTNRLIKMKYIFKRIFANNINALPEAHYK